MNHLTLRTAARRLAPLKGQPRNRMTGSHGFTLVELMVVIVIVGILSAVALPQFLGVKDKAKINAQLGEAAGLAKECAAAIITDGPYPENYPVDANNKTNTGLTISGNCNGGDTGSAPTPPVTFTTEAAEGNSKPKCGSQALNDGQTCAIEVDGNGKVTSTPSA